MTNWPFCAQLVSGSPLRFEDTCGTSKCTIRQESKSNALSPAAGRMFRRRTRCFEVSPERIPAHPISKDIRSTDNESGYSLQRCFERGSDKDATRSISRIAIPESNQFKSGNLENIQYCICKTGKCTIHVPLFSLPCTASIVKWFSSDQLYSASFNSGSEFWGKSSTLYRIAKETSGFTRLEQLTAGVNSDRYPCASAFLALSKLLGENCKCIIILEVSENLIRCLISC